MTLPKNLTAVILCGGKGLRAWPATSTAPKPLLRLAGRELIHHVMTLLAEQCITKFILAAGYRCDLVRDFAHSLTEPWQVDVVATPVGADTWDRIAPCREFLRDVFLVTYADGLANVDIGAMLASHEAHRAVGTITVVPLSLPFGLVDLADEHRIAGFAEKPRLDSHVVNAGFMLFDISVFEHVRSAGLHSLEREVLPELAAAGALFAHHHAGFFRAFDTYKDFVELEEEVARGRRPWLEPMPADSDVGQHRRLGQMTPRAAALGGALSGKPP
jgi:glucose-1-phosphate cytidylyltransferase